MGMHSDSSSTISMSILLNDNHDTDTTTVFIKGSHLYNKPPLAGTKFQTRGALLEMACGQAGDLLIWDSRMLHRAGSNLSGDNRRAVSIMLSRPLIKP